MNSSQSDFGGLTNNTSDFGVQNSLGRHSNENLPSAIVSNAAPKQKKSALIGVAVGLVLVILVIVAVFFGMNGNNLNGRSGDTKEIFTQFANYILSGEEGGNFPSEEYQVNANYALDWAVYEQNATYFVKANELFDRFSKSVPSEVDDSVREAVNEYSSEWKTIDKYVSYHFYDDEELLDYYLKNGQEKTEERINKEYQELSITEDDETEYMAKAYFNYDNYLLRSFNAINDAGCVIDNAIDEECASNLVLEQNLNSIEVINDKDVADRYFDKKVRFFIQDLWAMERVLNNE